MGKNKITTAGKTMELIREQGGICQVVERWQSTGALRHSKKNTYTRPSGVRIDLFGFIDIVACRDSKIIGIQCTTRKSMSARKYKILNECAEAAKTWLKSSGHIEIWGWHKTTYLLKSGKKSASKRWDVKIQQITLDDFEETML